MVKYFIIGFMVGDALKFMHKKALLEPKVGKNIWLINYEIPTHSS